MATLSRCTIDKLDMRSKTRYWRDLKFEKYPAILFWLHNIYKNLQTSDVSQMKDSMQSANIFLNDEKSISGDICISRSGVCEPITLLPTSFRQVGPKSGNSIPNKKNTWLYNFLNIWSISTKIIWKVVKERLFGKIYFC